MDWKWAPRVESAFQWHDQGVVTYMSPVEAFVTGIKNLDQWKSVLIAWLLYSEALDCLILWEFKGQNVATPAKYLRKCVDRLILVAQNSSWSLDRLLKSTWSLDSILIPVTNTFTGDVYVTSPWWLILPKWVRQMQTYSRVVRSALDSVLENLTPQGYCQWKKQEDVRSGQAAIGDCIQRWGQLWYIWYFLT